MGVSGVGKTTIGRLVAQRLGRPFLEADDFHTPEALARMAAGQPLSDAIRWPWLDRIHARLAVAADRGEEPVLACSALRADYRSRLAAGLPAIAWVHLVAPREVIEARLLDRRREQPDAVGPALLSSQLSTLEAPTGAAGTTIRIDASGPADAVATAAVAAIRAREI